MSAPYIINQLALADIDEIWLYTAQNWSVDQANRYYELIFDNIKYIVNNFDTARDYSDHRKGYRYSKVKSHIIFFKKNRYNQIEVVRVLHERMHIMDRLIE